MAGKAKAPKKETKVVTPAENKAKAQPKAKAEVLTVWQGIAAAISAGPTRRALNLLNRAAKAQQEGR